MIERSLYQNGLLVVTRCSGVMQAEELIQSAHWMVENYGEVIKPGFSQIFDALNANTDAISEEDIHRIAHINLSRGSNRQAYSMAIIAIKPYPMALAKLHKLLSTVSGDSVGGAFVSYSRATNNSSARQALVNYIDPNTSSDPIGDFPSSTATETGIQHRHRNV